MPRDVLIGIGAITRRRPQMFSELLESFEKLQVPEGVRLVFLFAENDDALSMEALVAAFSQRIGWPAKLGLETEPGIPLARNHVLDMALAEGCDFLTFVDDDETVDPQWLVELYGTIQREDLDLVGGPVRYLPPPDTALSLQQAAVMSRVLGEARKQQDTRRRRASGSGKGRIPIYTNNWMLRLSRQRELGVRFDESLRFTGGSDTQFYADFRAAGGRSGWSPKAEVSEVRPASRLSFRYYYERSRDQEVNRLVRCNRRLNPVTVALYMVVAALRAVILLVLAPVTRLRSLAKLMRVAGQAMARLQHLRGIGSAHYVPERSHLHDEGGPQRLEQE